MESGKEEGTQLISLQNYNYRRFHVLFIGKFSNGTRKGPSQQKVDFRASQYNKRPITPCPCKGEPGCF
jgi:hypothetical protein